MSWTPEQLRALDDERARKQAMRDAGVDPADPAEREAWDNELEEVPEHHNSLGDWCPGSGQRTADGTCPRYCREADELTGFGAGRDEDDDAS